MTAEVESQVFTIPARVIQRATTQELIDLARASRALDPAIFDEYPPFVWPNRISNDGIDAYFTRMVESTLRNYAADAAAGVSVLDSHNGRRLGLGQSLTGTVQTRADGQLEVISDAFTVPGYRLYDTSTDQYILGLKTGLIRDISVGFYGGQWICTVCGLDMQTSWWDCWHVPGLVYEQKKVEGDVTRVQDVLCIADVTNAHLAEYSLVYDGATPGAGVASYRAVQEAEAGRLDESQRRQLETQHRMHLPAKRVQVPGANIPKERTVEGKTDQPTSIRVGSETYDAAAIQAMLDERAQVRALAAESGAPTETTDPLARLRWLVDARAGLETRAKEGDAYRESLVKTAMKEGARAMGKDFNPEQNERWLRTQPLDLIQQTAEGWRAIGDKRFPGGRGTEDGDETPAPTTTRTAPAAAFKA